MDLGSWLKSAKTQIPALDAELIALEAFAQEGVDRSWLVTHDVVKITKAMQQKADRMVKRRADGEPLAYILGSKEFYGRMFGVSPDVLIPRPETEALVDLAKGLNLPKRSRFLEIGTGSGCLAVTLALEFPQANVLATDLSEAAIRTALANDIKFEGRVEFYQSDLLEDLPLFPGNERHFDVVVANLPYVNPTWDWLDKRSLAYEPELALYVEEENGLSLYRKLMRQLRSRQVTDGWTLDYLILEADPAQQDDLVEMAKLAKFDLVKTDGFGLLFEA